MTNLDAASTTIRDAKGPEDVFGVLSGSPEEQLRGLTVAYRQLATMLHPDRFVDVDEQASATRIFAKLTAFRTEAEEAIGSGTYGKPRPAVIPVTTSSLPITVATKTTEYQLTELVAKGDIADVYGCEVAKVALVVKVARSAGDNDLLANEATVLGKLYPKDQPDVDYYRYLPKLTDSFALRGRTGQPRKVNVLQRATAFVTLRSVMAYYQDGLDFRDVAWMWKRSLAALGFVHQEGFVHGGITPDHVMVHPTGHGAKLVDWCYAVPVGGAVKAMSKPAVDYYAPEILGKRPVGSYTDIYMVTKCVVGLLGGDPASGAVGESVPVKLRRFISGCLLGAPQRRPDNAWDLHEELDEILRGLVGKPQYRPLAMPA